MKIKNLTYYTDDGLSGTYGGESDPFITSNIDHPKFGKLCQIQEKKLKWDMVSDHGEVTPIVFPHEHVWHCGLSKDQQFLVVHFSGNPNWSGMWSSAAVFNADGSLHGQFTAPVGLTPNPAEGIFGVNSHDGSIEISVYYNYDSIAVIEFDPESMQWGKVVRLGGRA